MNAHRVKKDRRKEYTGSKRFDHSCRCHGGCGFCEGNRTYQDTRDRRAADQELKEWKQVLQEGDERHLEHAGWGY